MKEKWNTNMRLDSNLWCAHQEIPFLHAAGRHTHDLSCEIFIKVHLIYSSFHYYRSKHTFHSQEKDKPFSLLPEWVFQITTVIIPAMSSRGFWKMFLLFWYFRISRCFDWMTHPPFLLLNFYWKDGIKICVVWFIISKSSIINDHRFIFKSIGFKSV